ncbi:MAG: alpha/beta hydrolase [Gammaproteobacteria bacterium]|nr:MAG: alpha/beta hydrolase [Gammaproteobacteria bacterium]
MTTRPPRAERSVIPGPVGDLQALIEIPEAADIDPHAVGSFGVVCHPHPLYAGTLDNKVVYTLARAFEELGAPAIRFNFRGVGTSAGGYAEGIGETEDTLAIVAYGRERWPRAELWLAGFSFGAAVAIRAAARANAARLVTVAPAVGRVNVQDVAMPSCPWLIVQGDADDVVEPAAVLEWAAGRSPVPTVSVLPGAGHFFHGRLHELRETVLAFMRTAPETKTRKDR